MEIVQDSENAVDCGAAWGVATEHSRASTTTEAHKFSDDVGLPDTVFDSEVIEGVFISLLDSGDPLEEWNVNLSSPVFCL